MSRYEKTFHSTSGEEFRADVYSVLVAFGVICPARAHAIKKLLMPGQRGAKGEIQDLDEALVSVSRAIDMAHARLPDGGTLTGEPEVEPEPEPEPEPKPKLLEWRLCVWLEPSDAYGNVNEPIGAYRLVKWRPSGDIPTGWCPIEAQSQPIETIRQLPEGQEP